MTPFKDLLKRYIPGIDQDLYYIPKNSKRTLMSVMVLVASGWSDSFTDEEIDKAYKIIDLLLERGFDVNHDEGDIGSKINTPLELAKELQNDGSGKVYDYIMNKKLSATEAPQVLNKIGDVIKKIAGFPIKLQGKTLSNLAGLAYDHSKEQRKYLEDQEKYYKSANQSQEVDDPTEENLNEGIKDLEGASKQRYIIQNLPTNIKNNLKGEGLNKVVSKLSNTNQPYSSDFWKSLEAIDKLNSSGLVDFAFNGKFADFFIDLLERTKAQGLKGENQLRTLAFFKLHNFPIEGNLISNNTIKSIQEMGKFVNNNITKDSKTGEFLFKAKANTPQDKNGRELLNRYLKKPSNNKLSLTDISKIYSDKHPEIDQKMVLEILNKDKSKLATLMDRTYKPVFKGDNPFNDLITDIKKIVDKGLNKSESGGNNDLTEEQENALSGLINFGLKKKEALGLIQSIDDYSSESDLIVKALRKMGKK